MRLATALVVLAACGGAPAPPPAAPGPTRSEPVAPPATALPANVPDTPSGRQLAWVMSALEHGGPDRAAIEAHFAPAFLKDVPVEQVLAVSAQLAPEFAGARVTLTKPVGDGLEVRIAAKTVRLAAQIAVDAQTGLITTLAFRPVIAETMDEALALVPKLAAKASLLVAELDGTTCKPLHAVEAQQELAIGSAFKLYVLLGLVDQILLGKLAWDGELAIRDDWKSLPSGITQLETAGTKLPIRLLAERMISISDNTATDHLLYTVGRKNVEAALHTAKHAQPLLDVPFVSTRELFVLKLATPDAEVDRYIAMKASPRRAFLDGPLAKQTVALDKAGAWTTARHIEDLEWFASPMDMCNAMAMLADRATQAKAAPLLDVLAKNPGLPFPAKTWPYIGFKGGSEPGVLAATWLLRRDDGKRFVVSLAANNPGGASPQDKQVFALAMAIVELLAHEARP